MSLPTHPSIRPVFVSLVLLVSFAACGGEIEAFEEETAGEDAGAEVDGGVEAGPDAAVGQDAAPDAAAASDAALLDAALPDAGSADAALDAGLPDSGLPDGGLPPCPAGRICVDRFPFGDDQDSSASALSQFSSYACSPATDEGGPEVVYQVTVPEDGFLSAAVREAPGVDVDVHLLGSLNPADCLARGNFHASADVTAGIWFVVVDTYRASGVPRAGAFHVDIGFLAPSRGPCAMRTGEMPRVNDNGVHLQMPATGPVVLEAHLVTKEEPPPYPSTQTEELLAHYALSQARTGLVMHRREVWAPLEGGTFYGCGIGSPTLFPVEDEGWYVNMYWTSAARPARGTRMILRKPGTSRAVVVAAGYETGPGDLSMIGGTPEETHFYLGGERTLILGIADDPSLPLGPRVCQ